MKTMHRSTRYAIAAAATADQIEGMVHSANHVGNTVLAGVSGPAGRG
jgi:hypothetical protein